MKVLRSGLKRAVPAWARPRLRWAYGPIKHGKYRGTAVHCPCCDTDSRCFLPSRRTGRPHCNCPRCDAGERHRMMALYLRDYTDFYTAPYRVLHFAPEYFFYRRFKASPNLKYETADLMLKWVDHKVDITQIQFPDASFDVVICSHVLEHVPDDRAGMRELYRILKPGGWGLILVPIDNALPVTFEDDTIVTPEAREEKYGHWDHKRLYGQDYPDRLREAGFEVERFSLYDAVGPEAAQRYGLLPIEDIYLARKA